MQAQDPSPRKSRRDYVVLEELPLADLVERLLRSVSADEPLVDEVLDKLREGRELDVLLRIGTLEARNAPLALKAGGQLPGVEVTSDSELVQLVAIPARNWNQEPVRVSTRRDVELDAA